jgi:hypothetical protein
VNLATISDRLGGQDRAPRQRDRGAGRIRERLQAFGSLRRGGWLSEVEKHPLDTSIATIRRQFG